MNEKAFCSFSSFILLPRWACARWSHPTKDASVPDDRVPDFLEEARFGLVGSDAERGIAGRLERGSRDRNERTTVRLSRRVVIARRRRHPVAESAATSFPSSSAAATGPALSGEA